jgi:hypothetical protein
MGGVVQIPWYATLWRGDTLAEGLQELAPLAMRYGATAWELYRSDEDRYRIIQYAAFESKLDFERYWDGPEFTEFRHTYSSMYQVPLLYSFYTELGRGGKTLNHLHPVER